MYGEAKPPEASGVDFAGVVHGRAARAGVLVIDDSAAQRKMLVTLLRRWGFRGDGLCRRERGARYRARSGRSA
jgi:PleD family two-component response regulator